MKSPIEQVSDETLLKTWEKIVFDGIDISASVRLIDGEKVMIISAERIGQELECRGYDLLEV